MPKTRKRKRAWLIPTSRTRKTMLRGRKKTKSRTSEIGPTRNAWRQEHRQRVLWSR